MGRYNMAYETVVLWYVKNKGTWQSSKMKHLHTDEKLVAEESCLVSDNDGNADITGKQNRIIFPTARSNMVQEVDLNKYS